MFNFNQFLMSQLNYIKLWNEIIFIGLFVFVTTLNKYVLSVLRFTEPTVFQGWQTLVCIVLLSALIKFDKIKNEVQLLEKKIVLLLFPTLCCFTVCIVAGSIALASLPVPVFLAVTNVVPSILLILEDRVHGIGGTSIKVCGSMAICGTVVTLVVLTLPRWGTNAYLWLGTHVLMSLLAPIYLHSVRVSNVKSITTIYYNNFFSVAILVPLSIYLDVLHIPKPVKITEDVVFYLGCLLSGVFGTFLQLSSSKLQTRDSFFQAQGLAKILCSGIAYLMFFANIEVVEWVLIMFNLVIGAFLFNLNEKNLDISFHRPASNVVSELVV